jgi:hypothetical protein
MGEKKVTSKQLEITKAKSMNHIMRIEMEKLRSEVMFREYIGFEICYNLFKEFYSDKLKEDE